MIAAADPRFETAADAVVSGDLETLRAMLRETPALIHAHSSRPHRATLLHYLGANGVEECRQKSPQNAVAVAHFLIDAGAEVDAVANLYGGSTALGLVATSLHPEQAGVQLPLIETLLACGADPERGGPLVDACLANNRLAAAQYLASKGVSLNLAAAAGLGRLAQVQRWLDTDPGQLSASSSAGRPSLAAQGLLWACAYGQDDVVALFLDRGIDVGVQDRFGQTGLHLAAMGGRLSTIELLLSRGASLEVQNTYGGTVLGQALWSAAHARKPVAYLAVVDALLKAGAAPPSGLPPVSPEVDELLARWGCPPDPAHSW